MARGSADVDATLASLRGQLAPLLGGDWAGRPSKGVGAVPNEDELVLCL